MPGILPGWELLPLMQQLTLNMRQLRLWEGKKAPRAAPSGANVPRDSLGDGTPATATEEAENAASHSRNVVMPASTFASTAAIAAADHDSSKAVGHDSAGDDDMPVAMRTAGLGTVQRVLASHALSMTSFLMSESSLLDEESFHGLISSATARGSASRPTRAASIGDRPKGIKSGALHVARSISRAGQKAAGPSGSM